MWPFTKKKYQRICPWCHEEIKEKEKECPACEEDLSGMPKFYELKD
jgi:hypothetical protein